MELPEYFVVRVYRRTPCDLSRIEGMVEAVVKGTQIPFTNATELWAFLQNPSPATNRMQPK
jgi:hypothetical protein